MPRSSMRKGLLREIKLLLELLLLDGKENTNDFAELMQLLTVIESCRFLNYRKLTPKSAAFKSLLFQYSDRQFRQLARMSKDTFKTLVTALELHPIYQRSNRPRARNRGHPVWLQAFVALNVLGCEGNGASNFRIGRIFNVGHGTVTKYTQKFIKAINSMEKDYVYWPDANERREISQRFSDRYGLPDCTFIVDGTYMVFEQRPAIDGETYFTRKSNYATNVMIICDDQKRIRSFLIGWPGSVGDSEIWKSSNIYNSPEEHLSLELGEYGIADAGYALHPFLCVPYKQPTASIAENKVFNDLFSVARTQVERCIGSIKCRFRSLRGIRTPIRVKKDIRLVYRHIKACLILHNIMLELKDDDFTEDTREDDILDDEDIIHEESMTGTALRDKVKLNLLTKWHAFM